MHNPLPHIRFDLEGARCACGSEARLPLGDAAWADPIEPTREGPDGAEFALCPYLDTLTAFTRLHLDCAPETST